MPLPPNGTPWPPKELHKITRTMQGWDAWYSGDTDRLAGHYSYYPGTPGFPANRPAQYRPGVLGGIARWFWGQPQIGQQQTKLHIPVAADICQAGADLLFAEPPTFTVDDETTQKRLDELADDTLHSVLAESTEIGGALGGSYLRVSWDKGVVADKPFLTCVHADAAAPEFRYGRLVAVTFWTRVKSDGRAVWRHLERHELNADGVGIILHGLYQGSENDLGKAVPLTESSVTGHLAAPGVLTDGVQISTESPGLACVYVPNQRPQRRWRNDPVGCHLGRSALDGIEHLMDALDEVMSSWMRDIRLGKGRVFIAKTLLESNGPGQGASFDTDQEVFSPLNLLESRLSDSGQLPIQATQFAIRFAEHEATANHILKAILRTAGFSGQTFGMDDAGARVSNMTATEVQAHERRSYLTRDRMIRLTAPPVAEIVEKLLAVDAAMFNSGVTASRPAIEFADSVQESQITLAQTMQALEAARAASTKTKVELLHPDWDAKAVADEVTLIHAEDAAAAPVMPDPNSFTGADPATNPVEPPPAQ